MSACLTLPGSFLGCDRSDQGAGGTPTPPTRPLIDQLRDTRERTAELDGLDPDGPERLDRIIASMERGDFESLVRQPIVLTATLSFDEYVLGADKVFVHVIGPSTQIERVEILDDIGQIVGSTNGIQTSTNADHSTPLARSMALAYIVPSAYISFPADHARRTLSAEAVNLDPIELQKGWQHQPISARVVYGDGTTSTDVPIFVSADFPMLVPQLKKRRDYEHDREQVERIDALLADLEDPQEVDRRPRILKAAIIPSMGWRGTERIEIAVFGPLGRIQGIEVLDEEQDVIASSDAIIDSWEGIDPEHSLGLVRITASIFPSTRDPVSREEVQENVREIRVIELPADWHERPLAVRILVDGVTTEPEPITFESYGLEW